MGEKKVDVYKNILDDGVTMYDDKGNKTVVKSYDHILDNGKTVYVNGKKHEVYSYNHILDDGKTVYDNGNRHDIHSYDHILDNGKTVYDNGTRHDVYTSGHLMDDGYTVRDYTRDSSGQSGYGFTAPASSAAVPSAPYYPISFPPEKVHVWAELLILLLSAAASFLCGQWMGNLTSVPAGCVLLALAAAAFVRWRLGDGHQFGPAQPFFLFSVLVLTLSMSRYTYAHEVFTLLSLAVCIMAISYFMADREPKMTFLPFMSMLILFLGTMGCRYNAPYGIWMVRGVMIVQGILALGGLIRALHFRKKIGVKRRPYSNKGVKTDSRRGTILFMAGLIPAAAGTIAGRIDGLIGVIVYLIVSVITGIVFIKDDFYGLSYTRMLHFWPALVFACGLLHAGRDLILSLPELLYSHSVWVTLSVNPIVSALGEGTAAMGRSLKPYLLELYRMIPGTDPKADLFLPGMIVVFVLSVVIWDLIFAVKDK